MKLNTLNVSLYKKGKRYGRGIGSGKGKTAGRGVKGQKARSGVSIKSFEGGQMPLYRRLPKRGFNAIIKKHSYDQMIINLNDIQHLIEKKKLDTTSKVTLDSLRNNFKKLKILGNGEIKSKIQIEAHQISASAKTKIEKAGGSVNLLKQAEAK